MKVLVVGGGSIGTRHLNNLRTLGIDALGVVEPDTPRLRELCMDGQTAGFYWLEEGLAWGPDVAVIATPSHLHAEQALAAARSGAHLFVEKPLSHSLHLLEDLKREVAARQLVTLVGCNMRFHPGPARVKQLLTDGVVGRVLSARVHTGSYLPGWRPARDFRETYSASRKMGGGCVLDCIHEIDLARWYLGAVEEVFCMTGRKSSLELEVEEVAAILCRHVNDAISEIHLDYVQRTYERGCQIIGEEGSIFWDFGTGEVRWFEAVHGTWRTVAQPEGWDVNDMYVEEMRHFFACVSSGEVPALPLADAVNLMRVALAALDSAESGVLVCNVERS